MGIRRPKKKGSTRIPTTIQYNNRILSTPESIVNGFNEYFSSVFTSSSPSDSRSNSNNSNTNLFINVPHISKDGFLDALKL